MAKGPKGFSDQEKDNLRDKLCLECKKSWALHGYKKTNIGELTSKIGISSGAFYLLYPSKEDLFCDTLERIQKNLKNSLHNIISENNNKFGFIKAMNWHFQEFDKFPFLYNSNTPDFLTFLNKLPPERIEILNFDSKSFFYTTIELSNLILKIDKEKAYAVISTLLYTVSINSTFAYTHFEIFDFLLNSIFDDIFE